MLNTDTGIWAVSENASATECLTSERSRISGLAHAAKNWGHEVILNANTLETTYEQYNSLVIEKTIVDVSQQDAQFVQFFPSSELTGARLNPGTSPTFTHGAIEHG
ncbi:hypothetical protein [Rhodococcus erythropolis]|uniref:hypothetical protein n=1 Tax=Rhodococcus erythropolis TaxID=1833 RepID=UPI0008BE7C34|nr:hypothetical protein [Rhodococcus erythropolis]MDF2468407.1 hypothetical protein [Rhodococcus erythropolis]OFV78057.1 hypothetical protein RERY_13130 [Rhodococcus erythropolis]